MGSVTADWIWVALWVAAILSLRALFAPRPLWPVFLVGAAWISSLYVIVHGNATAAIALVIFALVLLADVWLARRTPTHATTVRTVVRGIFLTVALSATAVTLAYLTERWPICLPGDTITLPTRLAVGTFVVILVALANQCVLPHLLTSALRALYPNATDQTASLGQRRAFNPDQAGRAIGILERYLIIVFSAVGAPTAIGLVFAAKSVSRLKDFEDHVFVEYFLIGSLTSLLAGLTLSAPLFVVVHRWDAVVSVACT